MEDVHILNIDSFYIEYYLFFLHFFSGKQRLLNIDNIDRLK